MTIKWATTHVAAEEDAGMVAFERNDNGKKVLVVLNTSDTQAVGDVGGADGRRRTC